MQAPWKEDSMRRPPFAKRDTKPSSLSSVIYSVLVSSKKSIGSDGKIKCYLCPKSIIAKNTNGLLTRRVLDHAQFHLQKPAYGCKRCEAAFVSHSSTEQHLRAKHSLRTAGNYDCFADKFHAELSATISQCYDEETERNQKAILSKDDWSRMKGEQVIKTRTVGSTLTVQRRTYCNELLRRCVGIDGFLKCYLCSTKIRAKDGNHFLARRAIDHVGFHMQKPLYRCKICSSACHYSHASMKGHLKTKHALGMQNNNECHEDNYHQEILATLSECYELRTEGTQMSAGESTKRKSHSMEGKRIISGRTKGSKLAVERLLFCNTIVKKNTKPDGKMKCRLCTESIIGFGCGRFENNHALAHVRQHIRKAFYRCVACSKTYTAYSAMVYHITKQHALKTKGNYVSFEDEYHDDIMAKLSECFDDESSMDG